jgi:hypothetical protein
MLQINVREYQGAIKNGQSRETGKFKTIDYSRYYWLSTRVETPRSQSECHQHCSELTNAKH